MILPGDTIKIRFEANHQTLADGISRNIIAEITGSEFPNEVGSTQSITNLVGHLRT